MRTTGLATPKPMVLRTPRSRFPQKTRNGLNNVSPTELSPTTFFCRGHVIGLGLLGGCTGKSRSHRPPKWKTVSKQARRTCGRERERERDNSENERTAERASDRPKNAIVAPHFNGKLEWHCEEDSPPHLPLSAAGEPASVAVCINYSLPPPSIRAMPHVSSMDADGARKVYVGFVRERRPPRAIMLLSSPSD